MVVGTADCCATGTVVVVVGDVGTEALAPPTYWYITYAADATKIVKDRKIFFIGSS